MRFVFYTDVQLSGQTPRHRVDDYQQALLNKTREVYGIAKTSGADFVVCGGDLFNAHRMFSFEFLSDIMDVMCESGLKTYTAIGQHDILGYNRDTYKSSTMAFVIRRCPALQVIWEPTAVGCVTLRASHVWEKLTDAAQEDLDDSQVNVLVVHHLLTNKSAMFDTSNTSDFSKLMTGVRYDVVVSGDLHDGYHTHEVDGMWFCNPGSIARQAISDITRMPQVAVIDVEVGKTPFIDIRLLACAEPGEKVFGESAAEVMRSKTDFDPTVFVKEVEDFETESADIHDLVQKVGRAKGLRTEVLDYLASKTPKVA